MWSLNTNKFETHFILLQNLAISRKTELIKSSLWQKNKEISLL